MSIFSKIEVNDSMIPFIERNEGVGIVKVDGYGKSSARIESYKLILESYDGKQPIIESIAAITYLSYKEGNFFNEPKLKIGISNKKYILAGAYNNDEEMEAFYNKLLEIKNREKEQNSTLPRNFSTSTPTSDVKDITTENIRSNQDTPKNQVTTSKKPDVIDLEKEVINKDSDSSDEILDEIVEEEDVKETQKTLKNQKNIAKTLKVEKNDDEFEVLDELSEKEAIETIKEVDNQTKKTSNKKIIEEELEEDEKPEEIIWDDITSNKKTSKKLIVEEPIVEEAEDFDEDEFDLDEITTDFKVQNQDQQTNITLNSKSVPTNAYQSLKDEIEEETTNIERQVPQDVQDTQNISSKKLTFNPSKFFKSFNKKSSSIEISENLIPFIERNEGVGIVNVDGYGKASARIESNKFILESYEDKQPIIESLSELNNLEYKKGNIFNEPKLIVDILPNKYILIGEKNNDKELESFYNKFLEIKNNIQQQSSQNNMFSTSNSKVIDKTINSIDDVQDTIDKKVSSDKEEYDEVIFEENTNIERQVPKPSDNKIIEETSQKSTKNIQIKTDDSSVDVNEIEEQISTDNNNIQNNLGVSEKFNQYIPTTRQVDPVDQIKRYYELKEQGIITEVEFEQKKKQLLDL